MVFLLDGTRRPGDVGCCCCCWAAAIREGTRCDVAGVLVVDVVGGVAYAPDIGVVMFVVVVVAKVVVAVLYLFFDSRGL